MRLTLLELLLSLLRPTKPRRLPVVESESVATPVRDNEETKETEDRQ
jgi:hypothetical protein